MDSTCQQIVDRYEQSKINNRPSLLLSVTDGVKGGPSLSKPNLRQIHQILGNYLLETLNQSYIKVPGQLKVASRIAVLTLNSHSAGCVLKSENCPKVVLSCLNIACGIFYDSKCLELESSLSSLFLSLVSFFECHADVISESLKCKPVHRMLKYEFDRADNLHVIWLTTFRNILDFVSDFQLASSFGSWWYLHDQMVCIISTTVNGKLASCAVSILVKCFGRNPMLWNEFKKRYKHVERICDRWKGQKVLLLDELIGMYSSLESEDIKLLVTMNESAAKIQAKWRGFHARRDWVIMRSGFIAVQRMFRSRRNEISNPARDLYVEELEKLENKRRLSRLSRKYLINKFHTINQMHSSLVDVFLEGELDAMATKIQSWYKGCLSRRNSKMLAQSKRLNTAAVVLQRTFKRFVAKRRKTRHDLKWPSPTLEEREALQSCIDEGVARERGSPHITNQQLEQLINETQREVSRHARERRFALKSLHRRDVLLAKLELDAQILENAPALGQATPSDIVNMRSGSVGVATAGNALHNALITRSNQQWWKQLQPGPILSILDHPDVSFLLL